MPVDTHYGFSMDAVKLSYNAGLNAKTLIQYYGMTSKHPLLVYRGMSGVAQATALAMHLLSEKNPITFGQFYVRKPEEVFHSGFNFEIYLKDQSPNRYGGEMPTQLQKLLLNYFPVFVDDFVDQGETMVACMSHFPFWGLKDWMMLLSEYYIIPGQKIPTVLRGNNWVEDPESVLYKVKTKLEGE